MLVITRREGDRIRLAFDFPVEIEVNRRELDDRKLMERKGSGLGGSPVVGGNAPSPVRGGL